MNVPDQPRQLPVHPTSPYLRRRRRLRLLLATFGAVIACVALTLGLLWHLIRQPPPFYREYEKNVQQSPDELAAMAERVERRVLAELEGLAVEGSNAEARSDATGQGDADAGGNPGAGISAGKGTDTHAGANPTDAPPGAIETYEIFLTVTEANAWLSARFAEWMEFKRYHLPQQVTGPAIGIKDGELKVGFRYVSGRFSQVFSAVCDIDIAENGRARLVVRDIAAGRLPVHDRLGAVLVAQAPEEADIRRAAKWLNRADGHDFDPRFVTEKGLKLRVTQYRLHKDGVALVLTRDRGPADTGALAAALP